VTTLRPGLTFRPPATPFLGSSPELAQANQVDGRRGALIFGAPLDLTETFRSGAHGGPGAVRYMSDVLENYSPTLDRDLDELAIGDLGDLDLRDLNIVSALDRIDAAMATAASQARMAVMIGGEHTASLGGFRGLKRVHPGAVIVQVDAHLDMRPEYEGDVYSHATWLNHVGQEFGFASVHQVGLRSGSRAEWQIARTQTAWSSPELHLPAEVRQALGSRPIYLSIDIDVLDPAHAPGTGCPEPGGATFRELSSFLYSLEGLRVVATDVMEVSPNLDAANITAAAAAKLIREAILLFGA
jgi:agmatinase